MVNNFSPQGEELDLVCLFPVGLILVPSEVPFENAILLDNAWGGERT